MDVLIQFDGMNRWFSEPVSMISCNASDEMSACFKSINDAMNQGFYVAGFISFEAGYCLEQCLDSVQSHQFPLIKMGLYRKPSSTHPLAESGKFKLSNLNINISKDNYCSNIERIRTYIAEGDVYQITYCIKMTFDCIGNSYKLYRALYQTNPVPYSAYIHDDDFDILSLSPEMFFYKQGKTITTKPMKGTWFRGVTEEDDVRQRCFLEHDEKNRAENLMITDLLRNDLGRIGKNIRVPKLFEVTAYRTLFQMTSTVCADIPEDISFQRLISALFPSGSVTGAPKIRAMQIIKEIETEERHIYTGAIGCIMPDRTMYFNIPIRTLLIRGNKGEMGIGGGIVWDSTPDGEWDEGMLKASFLFETAECK